MSLLQRACLPRVLPISGSLVADFRLDWCIDGAGFSRSGYLGSSRVGAILLVVCTIFAAILL